MFDEVHQDGVPWLLGDWELFKESVGFVTRGFGTCATSARLAIVKDECSEIGPGIFPVDKLEGLILSEVARKDVVMFVTEYSEPKVLSVWDINPSITKQ